MSYDTCAVASPTVSAQDLAIIRDNLTVTEAAASKGYLRADLNVGDCLAIAQVDSAPPPDWRPGCKNVWKPTALMSWFTKSPETNGQGYLSFWEASNGVSIGSSAGSANETVPNRITNRVCGDCGPDGKRGKYCEICGAHINP